MKSHAGLGAEPDGFIIDPVKKELYIVEAELSKHDPYKHINDQLTRFINSMDNPHTKNAVVEGLWNKIKGNKSQKEYLEEKIDDEKMNERPLGVTRVAILTLLGSGACFMFFLLNFGLLFVGGSGAAAMGWVAPPLYSIMLSYPSIPISFILSVYAFFLSIAMFNSTSKYVWYASTLLWLMTIAFFSWWGVAPEYCVVWRAMGVVYIIIVGTLLPLACSIGCLIYFQTARVKDYFKIKSLPKH